MFCRMTWWLPNFFPHDFHHINRGEARKKCGNVAIIWLTKFWHFGFSSLLPRKQRNRTFNITCEGEMKIKSIDIMIHQVSTTFHFHWNLCFHPFFYCSSHHPSLSFFRLKLGMHLKKMNKWCNRFLAFCFISDTAMTEIMVNGERRT